MKRNPNRGVSSTYHIPSEDGQFVVRVPPKTVSELGEWISLRADFQAVRESLQELSSRAIEISSDERLPKRDVVANALVTLAITRYARAFKGSVRRVRLDARAILSKEGDATVLVEMHTAFLLLRDKHIAHSVSPLDQPVVSLVLAGGSVQSIVGVDTTAINMSSPEPYDLRTLDRLAFVFEAECSAAIRRLGSALFSRATEDLDWAYNLPDASITIHDFVDAVRLKRV